MVIAHALIWFCHDQCSTASHWIGQDYIKIIEARTSERQLQCGRLCTSIWHHSLISHWLLQAGRVPCSPIRILWILTVVNSIMSPSAMPKLLWHPKRSQWNFRRYKQASISLFTSNPNLKKTYRYRASPEKNRARRFSQFWWTIWFPKMPPTHPRGNFAGDHRLDQR